MSYLDFIKNFWIVHDANELTSTETALYFYLLEVNNKCRWSKVFNRNSSKIKVDLSISSPNTLKKACNRLKEVGLIDFIVENGSPIWIFTLSKFDEVSKEVDDLVCEEVQGKNNDTYSSTSLDTYSYTSSKNDVGTDSLNKTIDKDKDKDNNTPPLSPKKEEEYFLSSSLENRDGIRRNIEGLLNSLQRLNVTNHDEIDQILKLSNNGEIGNPVWGIIIRSFSKIRMPGKYIISELKKSNSS